MRFTHLLPFVGLAFTAPSQSPFDRKTLTVTGGHVYSYHFNPPQGDKPTLLLLHGFPSSLYDWRKTVPDLRAEGYGVIAPDLLGYGETSKPTAVEEYTFSKVSGHVTEILAHENVTSVVGVGHDIGAVLLSRFWNYYPESLTKLAFLAATYRPPIPWDLDAMNNATEQAFGYPIFGYWRFVNETTAPETILEHHDSFTSLVYTNVQGMWKTHVGPIGALKKWLGENQIAPKADYLTDEEYQTHQAIFAKGGYIGPTNWYKAAMANIDSPNDGKIPTENIVIDRPVLFVAGRNDEVGRPELAQAGAADGQKSGMLPNVQVNIIEDSVHWMQVQKPKETFELLDAFVKGA